MAMNVSDKCCPVCKGDKFDRAVVKREGGSITVMLACKQCGVVKLSDFYYVQEEGLYDMYKHLR